MNNNLVFVYGTLKKGFRNADLLSDATYITDCITQAEFNMKSYGAFPILLEYEEVAFIKGELYKVNSETLALLDELESLGELYDRRFIMLEGIDEPVMCYFIITPNEAFIDEYDGKITNINNIQEWVG